MQSVYHLYHDNENGAYINWRPAWYTILFDVPGLGLGPDTGIWAGYEKDKTTWGGPEYSGLAKRSNEGKRIVLVGCVRNNGQWTYDFFGVDNSRGWAFAYFWRDGKRVVYFDMDWFANRWTSGHAPSIPVDLRYRIRHLAAQST